MACKKRLASLLKGECAIYEIYHIVKEEERYTKIVAIVGHPLKRSSRIQFIYLTAFLLPGTL